MRGVVSATFIRSCKSLSIPRTPGLCLLLVAYPIIAALADAPAITSSLLSNAGRVIAVDPRGNVYWIGATSDFRLPVTPGSAYGRPTTAGTWSYLQKIDAQA